MDKILWIVWILSTLAWINPLIKDRRWLKYSAIGIACGAALNGLILYFLMPPMIASVIATLLIFNVALSLAAVWVTTDPDVSRRISKYASAALLLLVAISVIWIISEFWNAEALHEIPSVEMGSTDLLATSHHLVIAKETSVRLANNKLGELGNEARIEESRWFYANGDLQWLLPLAYGSDYKAWVFRNTGTEGYLMISAENDTPEVKYVRGYNLRYIPSAMFGNNLNRRVYAEYPGYFLADSVFQLDGTGKPIYVTMLNLPTIWGMIGEKPAGVVITDPQTGEMNLYDSSNIPAYVQKTYDGNLIKNYLAWYGEYVRGFWNSVLAQEDVIVQTHEILYYAKDTGEIGISESARTPSTEILCANDGTLYYTASMTNPNGDSRSMTGYVLANTKTLPIKLMFYPINESIDSIGAAQNIQQTAEVSHVAGFQITMPNLYNVSGQKVWMGPVITSRDEFAGVGIAKLNSGKAFVGTNLTQAKIKAGLNG